MRAYIRRYWSGDTETLALIDLFERAAVGQGSTSFGDALMSAFKEFLSAYPPPADEPA